MKSKLHIDPKPILYVLTDTEFTSFPNTRGEVFDIAFIFTDGKTIIEEFQSLIRMDEETIDLAIKNIGKIVSINKEALLDAPCDKKVCSKFMKVINKYHLTHDLWLVGYNVSFDYISIGITLRRACKEQFDRFMEIFPRNKVLDARVMVKDQFKGLTGYSLSTVCKALKIAENLTLKRDIEKHSALLDTQLLYELFIKLEK